MSERVVIRALGSLRIERGGSMVPGLTETKPRALLLYLAYAERPVAREVLGEMFWPYTDRSSQLRNLGVVIASIRKTIDRDVFLWEPTNPLTLNPELPIWLDAIVFEDEIAQARRSGTGNDRAGLARVLASYEGDFAEGFYINEVDFDNWIANTRTDLQRQMMEGAEALTEHYLDTGAYHKGIPLARRVLQMDDLRETAYRLLMELYWRLDDRRAAFEHYEQCSQRLAEAYDAAPSATTQALYDRIRRGEAPPKRAPSLTTVSTLTPVHSPALLIQTEHDIPSRAERLIGRTDQIAHIGNLLDQRQKVLLHGFPGMGKTVLAAETVATRIQDDADQKILWLPVGPGDEVDPLLDALARPLGASRAISALQYDEKLQALRNLFAEQAITLLVLDDVWNGRVVKQLLRACPHNFPVLLTSRHRIPVEGPILEITELALPYALELLSYHAQQQYSAEHAGSVWLCKTLGCHPYALEIVGKNILVSAVSPDELPERVGRKLHDMAVPEDFALEGRETIGRIIVSSVEELSNPVRDAFWAIGALFATSVTPELLALALDTTAVDAQARLDELRQLGLVAHTLTQYGDVVVYHVHDLAYSYARAHMQFDRQHIIAACAAYIDHDEPALDTLDAEIGNLLGAAFEARENGHDALLVAIMAGLAVKATYWEARGYTPPILRLLEDAATVARELDKIHTAHHLLSKVGNGYSINLGIFETAIQAYLQALQLADKMGDVNRRAKMLALIGTTSFRASGANPDPYYDQALAIAVEHEDANALGFVFSHRSFYEGVRQPPDYESARRHANEAVQLARQFEMYETEWASLLSRAGAERGLGHYDQALATDREALVVAKRHKNRIWESGALWGIGEDFDAMGDRVQAQEYLCRALILHRQNRETGPLNELIDFMRKEGYVIPSDDKQ